jgi:hypothetical protein
MLHFMSIRLSLFVHVRRLWQIVRGIPWSPYLTRKPREAVPDLDKFAKVANVDPTAVRPNSGEYDVRAAAPFPYLAHPAATMADTGYAIADANEGGVRRKIQCDRDQAGHRPCLCIFTHRAAQP